MWMYLPLFNEKKSKQEILLGNERMGKIICFGYTRGLAKKLVNVEHQETKLIYLMDKIYICFS